MIQKIKEHGIFLLLVFAFLLYAIKGINLPFYWDTGSFLIPAAHSIYQTHDLLRYTVAMTDYPHTFLLPLILSLFFNFFENPLQHIHFFSISISALFLITVYLTAKKIYSKEKYLPIFLVSAFITNGLFLSQTDLVYFEIIGGLLRILAIFALSQGLYKKFTLYSVIACFTRFENGLILPFVGLIELVFFQKNKKLLFSIIFLIGITLSWFLLHYLFTGWWIFSPERFFDERPIQALSESLQYLLFWQGRYVYTVATVLGAFFYLSKRRFNLMSNIKNHKFLFLLLINAIPTFIIIYKLGYFLPRYIFPVLLPFYILSYLFLKKCGRINRYCIFFTLVIFPLFQRLNLQNCFSYNFEDCTYVRNLLTTKVEAIKYLEKGYQNESIYTYYEDNNAFENEILGYTSKKFSIITENPKKPEVIFISPTSSGELYRYVTENNYKLIKSFFLGEDNCFPKFLTKQCKKNENKYILIFANEN